MRERLVGVVLLLMTLLGMNGCYFTSKNPLPKCAQADTDLLGCWKTIPQANTSETNYMLFLGDKNDMLLLVMLEADYRTSETYQGFISEIKGEKYLNLRQIRATADNQAVALDQEYYFAHYRIRDQRLELKLFNEDYLKQAVKNHILQGTLEGKSEELTLTDSSEHLASFISAAKLDDLLDNKELSQAERTYQLPELGKIAPERLGKK